jgi:hypothetical protein
MVQVRRFAIHKTCTKKLHSHDFDDFYSMIESCRVPHFAKRCNAMMSKNEIPGRHFAFIVNVTCHPDPFQIKLLRRTKTARRNMEFYKPNVLYSPMEMEPILQVLLDDKQFKHHW